MPACGGSRSWRAIGNIARVERRLAFVEADAFLILLLYAGGMFFLFLRGIG
jgi:hypothetical protein